MSLLSAYAAVEALFPEGLKQGILVTDRLPAQLKQEVAGHQVCLAHLLRNIKHAQQISTREWLTRFRRLLLDTIALDKIIDYDQPQLHQAQIQELHERKAHLLDQELQLDTAEYAFQKGMRKVSSYLLTCLSHKDVPPDNNGSERAIRNVKVKQKVSTMFKTMKGMETFAKLRTIIDTAIKRNIDSLVALRQPVLLIAE